MGVLNVTPDSFSDGGKWIDLNDAVARGLQMVDEGAAIVDIGGESTRPGALEISVDEECSRVIPVITQLVERLGLQPKARISIDTRHKEVALAAAAAGASIINDISASLEGVASETNSAWIAMHMIGTPQNMQDNPRYEDVVGEVSEYLAAAANRASQAGVREIYIDPGIGFGKTVEHNCQLLGSIGQLKALGFPVVVGTSRKSFISKLAAGSFDGVPEDGRLGGSIASMTVAALGGADIVRVHDVKESVQALRVAEAIASCADANTSARVTNK